MVNLQTEKPMRSRSPSRSRLRFLSDMNWLTTTDEDLPSKRHLVYAFLTVDSESKTSSDLKLIEVKR